MKYIAALGGARDTNVGNNIHWADYWDECKPCHFHYDYITHLDQGMFKTNFRFMTSYFRSFSKQYKKDENPAVLRQIGIDDIIQIKSAYSWSPTEKDELKWSTIPRSTAVKLYQKYFADFVIFGYSTDEVIPFINASDPKLGLYQVM